MSATTRDRMVLTALIQAFGSLTRPCSARVHTDCRYLSDGVTRTPPGPRVDAADNVDLWRELGTVVERHEVDWHWIDGDPNTARTNRLAMESMRLAMSGREDVTADAFAGPAESVETTASQDASDNGECVHELPVDWCSLCKPPKPGVLPYGYRTKGGNAYHNDPDCTWLDRGQRRADRQGKNVHEKVRIAWGDVTPGALEPCESCCTSRWLKRHGYPS
ncbi:ribonuclease HI [Actinophytocola oryzae]|uniref:Ribonuclease HI n=1 Tax=Actinophytocola oryzae TaxID=502181 RepID=A0A4R7V0F2_9PSEU|nr:ribonuclease HI [Actinophytocola oryzae]